MRVSPSITIQRSEIEDQPGNKLGYIAQIFRATSGLSAAAVEMTGDVVSKRAAAPFPAAVLRITGPTYYCQDLAKMFREIHGIPEEYIKIVNKPATTFEKSSDYLNTAKVDIEYFPIDVGAKTITVQFTLVDAFLAAKEAIDVEFDVSPDRTHITEVSAEISKLKFMVKEQVGALRNVKVATKPIGIMSWDREVSDKVQTEIKAKIKAALQGEITLPVGAGGKIDGGTKVRVELYGSLFRKWQEDGVVKNGWEAGFVISIDLPEPQPLAKPPTGKRIPWK